jgi:large subunit ribosomal protein L25
MSDALSIQAQLREKAGTGPSRSLRVAGSVPAVIYGRGEESKLVSISQKEADMLYEKSQVRSATVNLQVGGQSYIALPKQFSLHPVTDAVEHVDFMFVDGTPELQINIPIRIKGKERSVALKQGGVINLVFRSLACRVTKDKIPPYIEIDISDMPIGTTLRLKDINLPSGVKLVTKDLNQTFLRFTGKKKIVEEAEIKTPEAEAAAATEGAKAADKDAGGKEAAASGDKKDAGDKKDKK